jgi:hypothetical protein
MKPAMLCAFLALTICVPRAGRAQESSGTVAFVNVTVIPMDSERVLSSHTVLVERGIIARMGPAQELKVPSGTTIIDGRGKYLLPGFADLHVHIVGSREDQLTILQLFLANGVTTVLNTRGSPAHLALREEVATGRVLGPTIYTAGPYVNEPFVTTAEEVERAVVEQKRAGYDFIKMHGDLASEAYARLNAIGRREGIRIIGHAPRNLGLDVMFEEKQYAVVHAEEFIYDRNHSSRDFEKVVPQIPALARRMAEAGIWLMPNLTAFKNIGGQIRDLDSMLARPEMRLMPRSAREGWGPETNPYTRRFAKDRFPHIMARWAVLKQLTRGFHDAGVRLLVGTDAMNTGTVPGFSTHDELSDLVASGLSPFEALRAATANAADFLGAPHRSGIIAVGNTADLVLLERNPLEDITNARRVAGVMVRGRWLSAVDLRQMLGEGAR